MAKRMGVAGLVIALIVGAAAAQTAPSTQPGLSAAVVGLRGSINGYSKDTFVRQFDRARSTGAKVIIIDIDTPGGGVGAGIEWSQYLKRQRDIHTVAYIQEKAMSAGAMIALAANEIVMNDHAMLGDAAPIMVREDRTLVPLPDTERGKFESPVLAEFRTNARVNGYDELLATAMVSLPITVYWVESPDKSQRKFVEEDQYKKLTDQGWTAVQAPGVGNPVDGPKTLLTVDGHQAMLLGLARGTADTLDALIRQRGYNVLSTYEPGIGESVVALLSNPWLRAVLISLFLTALFAIFHAPGHGVAEVAAVACLAVLLGVPMLTGQAQWWEALVVVVGVILLAIEIFIIPGFGIVGITGIIMILGGLLMTFIAPEPGRSLFSVPQLPVTWKQLQNGLLAIVFGLAGSLGLFLWIRRYLPRLPYFRGIVLDTVVGTTETASAGSISHIEPEEQAPALGATGLAITDLRPGGSVQFRDLAGGTHVVSVVSDSGYVDKGTQVIVQEVDGTRIVVRPAGRGS